MLQKTPGGCARRSGVERGNALDVAPVYGSLGRVAIAPAPS